MLNNNIQKLLILLRKNFFHEVSCEKNDKLKHLIIVDRERYVPTFSLSIFSKAICKKFDLSPILVTDLDKDHNIRKIFSSFNYDLIFSVFRLKFLLKDWNIFFETTYFFLSNIFLFFLNHLIG